MTYLAPLILFLFQVDSWLSALHSDCKLETDTSTPNGSIEL